MNEMKEDVERAVVLEATFWIDGKKENREAMSLMVTYRSAGMLMDETSRCKELLLPVALEYYLDSRYICMYIRPEVGVEPRWSVIGLVPSTLHRLPHRLPIRRSVTNS